MRAVLFDLDGTLCDTIEDLTASINYALRTFDYPPRTVDEMRTFVGNGIRLQVLRALPKDAPEMHVPAVESLFRAHYAAHCVGKTRPYPGILNLLTELKRRGYRLGVITNKPQISAARLIDALFPKGTFALVMGQEPGGLLKPDPALLRAALDAVGADEAVYVGDSDVDVQFAHGAGLPCYGCAWGFRGRAHLAAAGADRIADTVDELLTFFD